MYKKILLGLTFISLLLSASASFAQCCGESPAPASCSMNAQEKIAPDVLEKFKSEAKPFCDQIKAKAEEIMNEYKKASPDFDLIAKLEKEEIDLKTTISKIAFKYGIKNLKAVCGQNRCGGNNQCSSANGSCSAECKCPSGNCKCTDVSKCSENCKCGSGIRCSAQNKCGTECKCGDSCKCTDVSKCSENCKCASGIKCSAQNKCGTECKCPAGQCKCTDASKCSADCKCSSNVQCGMCKCSPDCKCPAGQCKCTDAVKCSEKCKCPTLCGTECRCTKNNSTTPAKKPAGKIKK